MEPMYSLTMIGIIATILSVAFGLAALINSARHRKHLLEEKRSRQEADDEGGQQGLSDDNRPSGRAEAGVSLGCTRMVCDAPASGVAWSSSLRAQAITLAPRAGL